MVGRADRPRHGPGEARRSGRYGDGPTGTCAAGPGEAGRAFRGSGALGGSRHGPERP